MVAIMHLVPAVLLVLSGHVAARTSQWEAVADGIPELDAVEKALQKVATAKLGPKQAKAAARAVQDVEHVMADLRSNNTLTKAEKSAKVKGAIRELQSLQSQWEVAAVEDALKKVVEDPRLAPQQLKAAKAVVADVEAALDEVESGKLSADSRNKKVAFAIQKLQGLERELSNSTGASKEAELKLQIAQKKALLAKDEKELKLAGLEKELLEKKMQLQKLVAEKNEAEAEQKQRKESAQEQEQVSKLLAAAKTLAAARPRASMVEKSAPAKANTSKHAEPSKGELSNATTVSAIIAKLEAKLDQDKASLAKLDSAFAQRQADLQRSISESQQAPKQGKKDAIARGSEIMNMLLKREHRVYRKNRAMRMSEIDELSKGIQSIKRGDVAELSRLLSKMQHESKMFAAKANDFLH